MKYLLLLLPFCVNAQNIDTLKCGSYTTIGCTTYYVEPCCCKSYASYVVAITQDGDNDPVVTELSNDFGVTFTWTRIDVGVYTVTASAQIFKANKTPEQGGVMGSAWVDDEPGVWRLINHTPNADTDYLELRTQYIPAIAPLAANFRDDLLRYQLIEIKVFD